MEVSVSRSEVLATWTFQRRDERLTIQRVRTDTDEFHLEVLENGRPRTFTFSDLDRLVVFQSDMEAFLVRTGWSLKAFAPDRRMGRDRRGFPRIHSDRRRWWTDVPPEG